MLAKEDLISAFSSVTGNTLEYLSDRIVRIEVPKDWPIADAIGPLDAKYSLRLLVGRPFSEADFNECRLTTDAGEATAWRNDPDRIYSILVLGGSSGNLDAGLKDIRSLSRKDFVPTWLRCTQNRFKEKGDLAKEEVERLLDHLFEDLACGDISAPSLIEYLTALYASPTVSTVCGSLWHVTLMSDEKVLDKGKAVNRLVRNRELVKQLRGSDDPRIDQRLAAAARGNDPLKSEVAEKAIEFREDGLKEQLRDIELNQIDAILKSPATSGKGPTSDLTDVLNFHAGFTLSVRECLKQLKDNWDIEKVTKEIRATLEIDGEKKEVLVALKPKEAANDGSDDDDDTGDGLNHFWTGSDSEDGVLAGLSDALEPEDISLNQNLLRVSSFAENFPKEEAIQNYIEARNALKQFEPWLENEAFCLLLLNKDAREKARSFVNAWTVLTTHAASLDDRLDFQEAVQILETIQGEKENDSPKWITLGPLHPYRLDPILRTAEQVDKRVNFVDGIDQLGDAANWLLDHCYPSYPQIYHKSSILDLATTRGLVVYRNVAEGFMPPAKDGSGLDGILGAIEGFAPWLRRGMSILVIDPPHGGAVRVALERTKKRHKDCDDLSPHVYHQATGSDADSLDEYSGDLRYLPPRQSLKEAITQLPPVNIVLRFVPGPPGFGERANQDWSATRGCHLGFAIGEQNVGGPFRVDIKPQIKIDPRAGNEVVLAAQGLYKKVLGGAHPAFATIRPMFETDEAPVLTELASRTDWVIFAAPGPLGLISPGTINKNLRFVGRGNMGPYGLYVYAADDLFAVRRTFDRYFRQTPVATIPSDQMVERLVEKAQNSGRAILFAARGRVNAEVATLVALEIAQDDKNESDRDFVLSLDEFAWARAWLGKGRRADFVLIRFKADGSVLFRVVESKSKDRGEKIHLDPNVEPYKKALEQVGASLETIRRITTAETPSLDEDLRFANLIEQLMANVLAHVNDPERGIKDAKQRKDLYDAINTLSRREASLEFEGYAVLTQSGITGPRKEKKLSDEQRLVWAGASDVERVFHAQDGGIPPVPGPEDKTTGTDEPKEPPTGTQQPKPEEKVEIPKDEKVQQPAGSPEEGPAEEAKQEGDESETMARDFIAAAMLHKIPIAEKEPVYLHRGPSHLVIGIRLKEGTTLQPLRSRLADIARDMGIGDRSDQVEVYNDAKPRTVRVLLPRKDRQFPALPGLPDVPVSDQGYLPVFIGQEVDGKDLDSAVESWPHMLIAGTTGSGKTTFIRTLLHQLKEYGSERLQVVVVDGKGDTDYLGLLPDNIFPQKWPDILLGHEHAVAVLSWAVDQMDARQKQIHEIARQSPLPQGIKATDLYRTALKEGKSSKIRPLILVIDEFADIMLAGSKSADNFEKLVQRISQVGRSRLIHLVLATQRPDKNTIRGAIKANLNARVVFRLPTPADSLAVMGHGGADRLMLKGDMLFQKGTGKPTRLQGYNL